MNNLDLIKLYFEEKAAIAKNIEIEKIFKLTEKLLETYDNDGIVYVMANGGGHLRLRDLQQT